MTSIEKLTKDFDKFCTHDTLYKVIDTIEECQQICDGILTSKKDVAVDFEGINLCRTGELCIVQLYILDDPTVKIIDITTLGKKAFEEGKLCEVLESNDIYKVAYDPRSDSDALYYQFNVRMKKVLDVQIIFYIWKNTGRFIKSYASALEEYFKLSNTDGSLFLEAKKNGKSIFSPIHGGNYDKWKIRPLHNLLLFYAAVDVIHLHGMVQLWCNDRNHIEELTEKRIENTINKETVANGKEMAFKDFDLSHISYK